MPMFQKSEFESLKDLNLTPEQIKDALKAKTDLEAKQTQLQSDNDKMKKELETAATSFNEVKTRLDSIEANGNRRTENNNNNNNNERQKTSFLDDENAAFNERFVEAAGPVAKVALEAARNTARMSARLALDGQFLETQGGRIPMIKLWDKWAGEIDTAAKEVQLSALGNTQTWLNLLDYAIGKHSKELLGKTSEFVESVQSHTNSRIGDRKEPDKPNDEEAGAIAKMNKYSGGRLTPEKYTEIKNKMKFVNV